MHMLCYCFCCCCWLAIAGTLTAAVEGEEFFPAVQTIATFGPAASSVAAAVGAASFPAAVAVFRVYAQQQYSADHRSGSQQSKIPKAEDDSAAVTNRQLQLRLLMPRLLLLLVPLIPLLLLCRPLSEAQVRVCYSSSCCWHWCYCVAGNCKNLLL